MGDLVSTILEFFAKYAFAGAVLAAFILFLPVSSIEFMGLTAIRDANLGTWWILLIFASVLSGQVAVKNLWSGSSSVVDRWNVQRTKDKTNKREAEIKEQELVQYRKNIDDRLSALSDEEKALVTFCIMKRQQSITCYLGFPPATALSNKGILDDGQGTVLDMVYSFPDEVWKILLARAAEFLSNKALMSGLDGYDRRIRRRY